MMEYDIVYVVRPGESNEELRYSLRSLTNLPHRDVYVVGHAPKWVNRDTVNVVSVEPTTNKWINSSINLLTAVKTDEISQSFIVFHDDFFVMHHLESVPLLHRGLLDDAIYKRSNKNRYYAGMVETREMLNRIGVYKPLCYELHIPRVVNKHMWIEATKEAHKVRRSGISCLHNRTFYGNYWAIGGVESHDFKISVDVSFKDNQYEISGWPFISTNDRVFRYGSVGTYIKNSFPNPSIYELGI